jgi:hypothetical protein
MPTVATRSTRGARQEAQRRGDAGRRRADHPADAELARDVAGVDRSGAARAQERVVARIAPALGDVHARRTRHALVDDVVNTPRHRDRRQAHGLGQPSHRRARGREVDRDRAAREVLGVQVAEEQIGVGDGWLRAAQAVAGRAGLRAGAARPDLQEPDLVT